MVGRAGRVAQVGRLWARYGAHLWAEPSQLHVDRDVHMQPTSTVRDLFAPLSSVHRDPVRQDGELGRVPIGMLLVEGVRVEARFDEEGELVEPELLAHERWHRILPELELRCALYKLQVLLDRNVAADQLCNLAGGSSVRICRLGRRLRMWHLAVQAGKPLVVPSVLSKRPELSG